MITSKESEKFFSENKFQHGEIMNAAQFKNFMDKTPNGRSTKTVLKEFGLQAESARVLKYSDADEFEDDSDDEYEKQNADENLIYSVVIKTGPLISSLDPRNAASPRE